MTQALQMQMEVQKRLHEQLEVHYILMIYLAMCAVFLYLMYDATYF